MLFSKPGFKWVVIAAIAVSIVVVLVFVMYSIVSSKSGEYGVLDYLPYDKVMELYGKGYDIVLIVSSTRGSNETIPGIPYFNEFIDRYKVFVYGYVYKSGHSLKPNLFAAVGDKGLFDELRSSVSDLYRLTEGDYEEVEGYRVWVKEYNGYGYLVLASSDGDTIVYIELSSRITEYIGSNDAVDLAVSLANALREKPGWKDINREFRALNARIPLEYRNMVGIVCLEDNMTIIGYSNGLIKSITYPGRYTIYAIVPREFTNKYMSDLRINRVFEMENYVLVTIRLHAIKIQDATLVVLHMPSKMKVTLLINVENIIDSDVRIKEVIVDSKTVWTGETIVKPGTTYSRTYDVYTGEYTADWEVGTEHMVSVVYDVIGGEQDQVVTVKVRAT